MKSSRIKLTLIIMIVVFELQFLSHLVLDLAPLKENRRYPTPARISSLFFPLDPNPKVVYGHGLLAAFCGDTNRAPVEKSVDYFRKAIHQNMLFYQAHFYLAKAYLCLNRPNTDDFSNALSSLKRAATLRRGNLSVGTETLKVLVPMWPLLNEGDRTFVTNLFKDVADKIKREEMKGILEFWGLYVGDFMILKDLLAGTPAYYSLAADIAIRKHIPLSLRHEMMSLYEQYFVLHVRERLRQSKNGEINCEKQWVNVLKNLKKNIPCYHGLLNKTDFSQHEYGDLKKFLQRNLLVCLFSQIGWKSDPVKKSKMEDLLLEQAADINDRDVFQYFDEFLQKRNFFNRGSIRNFYLQQIISYKLSRYETVIYDIEDFGRSVAYVKEENKKDYIDLLLLLSEAYFSSRLLTKSQAVLDEVEKLSPGSTEVMWRRMRIEKVLGPDNIYDNSQMKTMMEIRGSRRFTLEKLPFGKTVYLLDSNIIEISLGEPFRNRVRGNISSRCLLMTRFTWSRILGIWAIPSG